MKNPLKIPPGQLTPLLNSTPLGQVLGERQLGRNLQQVGYRIAGDRDAKTVNLFKFAAWQVDKLEEKGARKASTGAGGYEAHKAAASARSAAASAAGRDIGDIPEPSDPERRERCRTNLRLFLETYFPKLFYLGWSTDHIRVISQIEDAALNGGLYALAMPRGQGKTTICECASIWVAVYGHRRFVVPVGSTADAGIEMLNDIKMELETNELLGADFPEVCYPVAQLDGVINRCGGQMCNGVRTRITWGADEIVFPTIKGSAISGTTIKACGLLGRVRGMKRKLASGKSIRPDFVLLDDPQTDESAYSPDQNRKRLRVISGAIMGLAGPGKKIAGVMPCTVIAPGDMADQVLDRKKHPEWNGERLRLLVSFPANMELWATYQDIWGESLRTTGTIASATEFYREHQAEMDEGAESSWPERFEPGEISGIQYAMNLLTKDKESFWAEYQNAPQPDDSDTMEKITIDQVFLKLNGRPRGEVPGGADRIVSFIDVQKRALYWIVMAFKDDFTGWVVDYGTFPDQKRRYFTLRDIQFDYPSLYPGTGLEGAIYAACRDCAEPLLDRTWRREDGIEMKISRCMIDSGWGKSTDAIFQFCRESRHAALLLPSKGEGKGPTDRPFSEYRKNQGDRIGFNWMIPNVRKKRTIRYLVYDTNFWKTFFRERLLTPHGDVGSVTIYGRGEEHHRQLAEHLSSEYSEPAVGRGRRVDVWSLLPGRSDNHWLDGAVGCCVAASESGSTFRPGGRRELEKAANRSRRKPGRTFAPGRVFGVE